MRAKKYSLFRFDQFKLKVSYYLKNYCSCPYRYSLAVVKGPAFMAQTHEILLIKPKPSSSEISRLTADYFNAKGRTYDIFEKESDKRDLFTESVNRLIAADLLKRPQVEKLLSIACGTGRREKEIECLIQRKLNFLGIEISASMASLAEERGLRCINADFVQLEELNKSFDAAFILSSFGHIPDFESRSLYLRKLHSLLIPGAVIYLDVLSLEDENEWGPQIIYLHEKENLGEQGFELGDVLYRKISEPEICFYHYFRLDELRELLSNSGFRICQEYFPGYGKDFGQLKHSAKEGAIFIIAERVI